MNGLYDQEEQLLDVEEAQEGYKIEETTEFQKFDTQVKLFLANQLEVERVESIIEPIRRVITKRKRRIIEKQLFCPTGYVYSKGRMLSRKRSEDDCMANLLKGMRRLRLQQRGLPRFLILDRLLKRRGGKKLLIK